MLRRKLFYLLVAICLLLGMMGPAQVLAAQPVEAPAAPLATTVTLDGATFSQAFNSVSATPYTVTTSSTIPTGTGSNRLMLVGVSWNSNTAAATITGVTYSYGGGPTVLTLNQLITQKHGTTANYRYSAIYYYVNPPSGQTAGTVAVTFSAQVPSGIVVGVANFAGVDQTTAPTSWTSLGAYSPSNNSTVTVTLTGLTGNELVFDNVFLGGNPPAALTVGANQSQLWSTTCSTTCNTRGASSTEDANSNTSVTMSWTAASSSLWVTVAVAIKPAPAGPAVTMNQAAGQADPTNASPINFTAVFSEPVTGFATGDVTLTGTAGATTGTVTEVAPNDGTTYNVAVSGMTGSGTVTAAIAAGVAQNGSSQSNAASTSADNTVAYDVTNPTVTVNQASAQADPTSASPINFTVVFSEPVTDFATGDVTLSGTAGATTGAVTGSGATYNVAVSGMTGSGTVVASIDAGKVLDAAGNGNDASTSTDNTVTYNLDTTAPTVTIDQASGQADPTGVSPINFTVVFSEPVTDFATGDVSLSGTAGATAAVVTGSGTTYNVAVSGMTTSGTVIASIAVGVAHDAAGNPNDASTSTDNTVTYEAPPIIYIGDVGSNTIKNNGVADLVVTTTADVTAGDAVIIAYATDPTPDLTISISDSAGNKYQQAAMGISVQSLRLYIFAAYNVNTLPSGSTITIKQTVVGTTIPTARSAVVSVFRGLAPEGALEQSSVNATTNSNPSTTPSSGAATTVQPVQLLIGAVGTEGPGTDDAGTWGNSFTAGPRAGTTATTTDAEITVSMGWQIVTSAGSYTAAKSGITSRDWAAAIATFKPTDAGISYIGDIGRAQSKTAGTSLAVTTDAAVAAGDDIMVVFSMDGNADAVSVSDGVNTYGQVANAQFATPGTGNVRTVIFAAYNVTALPSGSTITINHPSITARSAVASAFRGLADSTVVDRTHTGSGTTNPPTSGATDTTTQDYELLIGAVGLEGGNYDAPSVWVNSFTYGPRIGTGYGTTTTADTDVTAQMGWRIVGSTGAYTAQTINLNTVRDWAAGIATFKAGPMTGTIIVEKQTEPDGMTDEFTFTGAAVGSIADGGQIVVEDLAPGIYTTQETVADGWALTDIVCDDANSVEYPLASEAEFHLEAGETVKCTFYNELQMDFGDAPDVSYQTLLASNGARHVIIPGRHMGPAVDAEPDGQPSPLADGDDLNPIAGPDDEDGVILPAVISAGNPAVAVSVDGGPSGGMLDAWIDFNGNGAFDHPAEHLWGGASKILVSGPNLLTFAAPATAAPGPTYARFRLSTAGSLSPFGPAEDGEVEDYPVQIIDTTPPTLSAVHIQSNNADTSKATAGDTVTLSFTASESIQTPVVSIAGHAATVSGGPVNWSATYVMANGDPEGVVAFSIAFSDLAGNAGADVTATTDASSVTFAWALDYALTFVQNNTTLVGDLDELTATFPDTIPLAVVAADYKINSRMTVADALPAGSKVTIQITVNGSGPFPYVTDAPIPASPFWVTDLFTPAETPADFDAGYGGRIEIYNIIITGGGGNPLDIDTTVKIESVISDDDFATETVLAALDDIPVHIDADEAAALAWLQANTVLSSVSGTIADLKATFPASIPPVIVAAPYVIDSRLTLANALPAGATVTVYREGAPVLTDITLTGVGPFWFTELFDPDAPRAPFDAGYGGAEENYVITLTGPGGNPLAFETTVTIESVISKDGFTSETVLDDIELAATIPADEAAALAWLQANTVLSSVSGTIADLKATFPASITPVIVAAPYVIDSRLTLANALPAGTTVTIYREGVPVLSNITLSGTGPFWFTELFDPDAPRAAFDAGYGGAVENYVITLTGPGGNPLAFETTVFIESVISKDGFTTETVLDDITLDATIPADEEAALAWLQANTVLSSVSGTIADLTATFPATVPPVIVAEPYVIDSRLTLANELPAGTTVTVYREGIAVLTNITLSGTGPFWFTELFDPDAPRAAFDAGYGGAVENYVIVLTGPGTNPLAFETTVFIESVISKDGFTTETVLDDITLDATIPADEEAALSWLQANTVLSSVSRMIADLKATFPASIPPVIVAEPYVIDSRLTLAEALPTGTTVTVYREGVPVLTDITLNGTGPFWFTELFDPDAPRAAFDAGYGGAVENYVITLTGPGGNPLAFETTVFIESVISKDGFTTETVLDDITLDATIPADEAAALAWLQANTVLSSVSGTIADLKATFPASIPPVIVAEPYVIDSRLTLANELPAGTTVTVYRDGVEVLTDITLTGAGPFWFTELFNPDAPRAAFDAGYGGAVENYVITLTGPGGNPLAFETTVFIESVISKDGFTTETVLDDITLDATIPADVVAPTLDITGMTADEDLMAGNLPTGYILPTTNNADLNHLIQFAAGTAASEPLRDAYFGLFLVPDETSVSSVFLKAYYDWKGVPDPYLAYLKEAADGNEPFVFIKGNGTTTVTLVDAAKHDLGPGDGDMTVPDTFPSGTYTVQGVIKDLAGNETTVTLILVVEGPDPAAPSAPVVSIVKEGSNVRLSWEAVQTDANGNFIGSVTNYYVYFNTTPYFVPGVTPETWSVLKKTLFHTDTGVAGTPGMHFYIVRAENNNKVLSADSNHLGVFVFPLVPGTMP